jgi:hypothetical protein
LGSFNAIGLISGTKAAADRLFLVYSAEQHRREPATGSRSVRKVQYIPELGTSGSGSFIMVMVELAQIVISSLPYLEVAKLRNLWAP